MSENIKYTTILKHKEQLKLVSTFFTTNLPFLLLEYKYDHPSGFWGFTYKLNSDCIVMVECHRGFFTIVLIQSGNEYHLASECRRKLIEIGDYKEYIECQLESLKSYFLKEIEVWKHDHPEFNKKEQKKWWNIF